MVASLLISGFLAALPQANVIKLSLSTPKSVVKSSDPLDFSLKVKNIGKQAIVFPSPQDGSDFRRFPRYWIEWRTAKGVWTKLVVRLGRCGNTNPIEPGCFKPLGPGEAFASDGFNACYVPSLSLTEISEPGVKSLRAVCDTTGPLDDWIGGPVQPEEQSRRGEAIRGLLDQTPRGKWISNVAVITVTQ